MAARRIDALDKMFETSPSISPTLTDFEREERPSNPLRLPSHRSGFASDHNSESGAESNSEPYTYSPKPWHRQDNSSGWYRHQPYLQESPILRSSKSPSKSRGSSPLYADGHVDEDEDETLAANIPLPEGSVSPAKGSLSPVRHRSMSPEKVVKEEEGEKDEKERKEEEEEKDEQVPPDSLNNCASFVFPEMR
jgi:hypothetical protein